VKFRLEVSGDTSLLALSDQIWFVPQGKRLQPMIGHVCTTFEESPTSPSSSMPSLVGIEDIPQGRRRTGYG
jgi:hypothetical protein